MKAERNGKWGGMEGQDERKVESNGKLREM